MECTSCQRHHLPPSDIPRSPNPRSPLPHRPHNICPNHARPPRRHRRRHHPKAHDPPLHPSPSHSLHGHRLLWILNQTIPTTTQHARTGFGLPNRKTIGENTSHESETGAILVRADCQTIRRGGTYYHGSGCEFGECAGGCRSVARG